MDSARLHGSQPIRILLVDDNQTHQYSLGRHLRDSGFEVLQAQTGSEALHLATSEHPDIVLLDIHLPDLLGFDVCKELKANPATKPIPVIFHSATYETQSARSTAADLGALSFLSYPIDVDHLISVIHGALLRSRAKV